MENNNNEEKMEARPCPRNCKLCSLAQQAFCGAQIGSINMGLIQSLVNKVEELDGKINRILEQVTISAPIAQERGSGAENRLPGNKPKDKNNE
jgi:hypothetical protein